MTNPHVDSSAGLMDVYVDEKTRLAEAGKKMVQVCLFRKRANHFSCVPVCAEGLV